MSSSFIDVIQSSYDSQSKTFKKITNYIRENYSSVLFLSISELSKTIDVSLGSITRYCHFLGYSGYQDMMNELRNQIKKEMAPLKIVSNAISTPIDEDDVLKSTIETNLKNIAEMYNADLQQNFNKAVETIANARNVYIIGMRSAFTPAYYIYHALSSFMDNIHLLTQTYSDIYDHILNINNEDVLISLGFSKYTKLTCDITEYFSIHGSSVITLTDSVNSPLAQNAKAVLVAYDNYSGFSYAQPIIILNALMIAVGKLHQKQNLDILNRKRQLLIENGVHYYNK